MADIGLSCSRLIADEVRDAETLAALAWQVYGLLATMAFNAGRYKERNTVEC